MILEQKFMILRKINKENKLQTQKAINSVLELIMEITNPIEYKIIRKESFKVRFSREIMRKLRAQSINTSKTV